jgi:methylated-DNA-[protein]-cysteine S-methyltransferase
MNDARTHRSTLDSPVGTLTIIATDVGVRAVMWPRASDRSSTADPAVEPAVAPAGEPTVAESDGSAPARVIAAEAADQLAQYFAGTRTAFDVPLDPVGTDFQRSAWNALRTIPYGETLSYGQQAERMGDRRKARAVGAANGRNPISIIVPCHRVVGSDGSLTGFAGGIENKRFLLDLERRVSGRSLV